MELDKIMYDLSDKASWSHNYCGHYGHWFAPLKGEAITLLELGIGGEDTYIGKSLIGWSFYFENGIIGGVDLYDKKELEQHDRIYTYQGSQDDPTFLKGVVEDLGTPNIIIDDASHLSNLTIKSFEILFPLLKSGGLYCIEDLDCAYDKTFNGSPIKTDKTSVTYLMDLVYDINSVERRNPSYKRLRQDIESIHFYNDLCIIKKK